MAESTKIEWADATVNTWWGCTKISPGCTNCYAATLAARFGQAWGPGAKRTPKRKARATALLLNRRAKRLGRPIRVFALSMGDWLDPEVPAQDLVELLDLVAETPDLLWMLLTKRPQLWGDRLGDVVANGKGSGAPLDGRDLALSWLTGRAPANVWVGTSVEDQQRANERIPALLKIPTVLPFLSLEPLLEAVDLRRWLVTARVTCKPCGRAFWLHEADPCAHAAAGAWTLACPWCGGCRCRPSQPDRGDAVRWVPPADWRPERAGRFERVHPTIPLRSGIGWVIAGGESGAGARPMHPAWARSLRDQAVAARVPFFFKQWGQWEPRSRDDGRLFDSLAPHNRDRLVSLDGNVHCTQEAAGEGYACMSLVGKVAAGRLLDGRTWNELPEVRRG